MVIPKNQYPRVLGKTNKYNPERFDKEIRTFLKKALHLPHDTPNAAFYANVRDGGLGVLRFTVLVPALRKGAFERLSTSYDWRVARIAEALLTPVPSFKELREAAAKRHKDTLYASADGRGLLGMDTSPPTHEWVDDGTLLMRGSSYISAIKTRLGVAYTKIRASRGRSEAPVMCDLGCGRVESLGHILQVCPKSAPERTARHDRVLSLLVKHLTSKTDLKVLRKPTVRTSAGARRPDVILWDHHQSVVLDVQIVSDNSAGNILEHAHGLKVSYYDTEDIRAWVRTKTCRTPVFATLTINWRGAMATQSYMALKSLGLNKGEIRLLTVRSLEGSVAALRSHRDMGGWG